MRRWVVPPDGLPEGLPAHPDDQRLAELLSETMSEEDLDGAITTLCEIRELPEDGSTEA